MMVAKGLLRIVAIKSLFPKGWSDVLRLTFPSLSSVENPSFIPSSEDLDPYWLAGFANEDGHFTLGYFKDPRMR
jgi:hypothetical protein